MLHAVALDRAVEDVQRSERSGGAVADIVTGHGGELPSFVSGNAGWILLSSSTDSTWPLAERAHVEADNVVQLADKLAVLGKD